MIRRVVQVIVVGALVAAGWLFQLEPASPDLGNGVEPSPPNYTGCVGVQGRQTTTRLVIGSTVRGDAGVILAVAGAVPKSYPINPAGALQIPFERLGPAAGEMGALVELPTADAAAATVIRSGAGVAAALCTPPITTSGIVSGGSTLTGETLDLVLANPYAVDAVVAVQSSSEVGEDSADELASVLVPAHATIVRSIDSILTLRQSLTVKLGVTKGAIHAALVQTTADDLAVTEAVAPAQDWWIPIQAIDGVDAKIVIASDAPLDTSVTVDAYSGGSVSEAIATATIPARTQLELNASDLGPLPLGLRVTADNPVVVTLVMSGATAREATPGASTLSSEWIVPGSGTFNKSELWVFNPGEVGADLVIQPLAPDTPARPASVPADAVVAIPVDPPGSGYLIRSTSEIAVLWGARIQAGLVVSGAYPAAVLAE
jgi:hypothetical protein